jgi:hypothetical protein
MQYPTTQSLFVFITALFLSPLAVTAEPPSTRTDPAIEAEILRRTKLDFNLTPDQVLKQLQENIADATAADVKHWSNSGELLNRTFDGEIFYFHNAVPNLFRVSAEARKRRTHEPPAKKKFDLNGLVQRLVEESANSDTPEIHPVRHRVKYSLSVKDGHPLVKPDAIFKAWLPFPQEYRQQHDVRLLSTNPLGGRVASADAPQRSIYFEQKIGDDAKAPRFEAEFEFTTSAYCPRLDPAAVKPYDESSPFYKEFTAERAPHILITPEVRKLASEIIGSETNPLNKALLIFRWVSKNLPWVSEMEYCTISSLSAKGLKARCGDCGVQSLTFITLCRAAGIPARWQSGFGTKPGEENMHDWSEFYTEPYGWLPADASYGVREHGDPRVRDFFCGHMDPYRLIVNLDYGRELEPPKQSFRSEPTDFQRGEVEIDGQNLYFNEWDWKIEVTTAD